ncbi:probable pectinesterase/pectinesterase inhibitor 39 [Henckelia pumila]|uniref:probable pectinesterase/pectinesterase inhibitor 39 n=1 Tax=Henckelia pumila TaxID=405737 RepID=UPI003C6E2C91
MATTTMVVIFLQIFPFPTLPAASFFIDSNPTSRQLVENAERIPSMVGSRSPVSKDGKGEFRSISEALEASPSNSNDPVYINIESGEYYELINVGMEKTNIVLKGAGIDRMVIVSNGSLDGSQSAATLKNLSDYSVFYNCNCKLKGVNGSLKAKGGNQFYRGCNVHGQNHLVSGYTTIYFQKSSFFAETEKAVFSSQSSFLVSDKRITFNRCSFYAGQHMKNSSAAAYLGELLGKYSKIVVIL